jgi:hypothetical protein
MAEINQLQQRQLDAVKRIVASGCDPRNFQMLAVSHYDGDFPRTIDDALAEADLVFRGHVTSTSFKVDPNIRLPVATSTLALDEMLKGTAVSEITLHQVGGPLPQDGGIIGHFQGEPVLLRGDEVLLIAEKRKDRDGYSAVYPLGIYSIRNGAITVPDGSPCDWLHGYSIDDALRIMRASLAGDSQDAAQPCDWSRF